MVDKRIGMTLIEIILAMAILSILLVAYIAAFGQNTIIVARGKDITTEIFSYQEIMENRMLEEKRNFVENKEDYSYSIDVFSDNDFYKSKVQVKEIITEINNNRKFIGYVSNYEIIEPNPPKLKDFSVGVYDSDSGGKEVFPWFEDNIRIRATYKVESEPKIFENRLRWYGSKEEINNPVFPSDYEIVEEIIQNQPRATTYTMLLKKDMDKLKPKRFYYFEARPYTFAGKLEHYTNEDRILILNRAGSQEWQNFMEDIYFKTVKIFDINNTDIYLDIMQNPEHPTLNLDWFNNEDPQGSLVGMIIPNLYSNNNFQAIIDFQIDNDALLNAKEILGIGVGLVNDDNSGLMIDFDVLNNLINIYEIENGKYKNIKGPINSINIQSDNIFKEFKDKNNGNFDWTRKYSLIIEYFHNDILSFKLEDDTLESDFIGIDMKNLNINPKYIGLKSYSNLDYKLNTRYEIISKYDRNYSSHFYDISFKDIQSRDDNWIIAGNDLFYNGASNTIKGGSKPDLKVKMTREKTKLSGNRDVIIVKAIWFAKDIVELKIGNNHPLEIKTEEVIFDVPIKFDKNAAGIEISGIDAKSYPVKVYFREGEKVKINNENIINVKDGGYFYINSGTITIKDSNGIINIYGNDIYYKQ